MFMQRAEGRVPILVRLIIDGKTGKLKSEEKVAELMEFKRGSGYAVLFGGVDIPDFEVVKDPESEYYAIILYNSFAEETKDRIEVLHLSPQHKVINRAKYTSPSDHFKYTKYLNTYVNKDNYVVLATYAYNTAKSGGSEARFYISQLSKGKTGFKQQELPYTNYYKGAECTFCYNKAKQVINMCVLTDAESRRGGTYYEYRFQNINPTTLKLDKEYSPDFTAVNAYYLEKMEREKEFDGMLRKISIDRSGNMIMFFQQKKVVQTKYGVDVYYGDVALLTVSPEGKTINSAVFPASLTSDAGMGQTSTMNMICSEYNIYILFDNTVENMERPETKKAKTLKSRGPAVPVKYTYLTNAVKKEYLFKAPKEPKGNPYCDFGISDYNPATKKYAVMYIDPEKDKAGFVYVTLD